jgi:DNA-binding NtrC family response regulator
LENLVNDGKFRSDLYYRLKVVTLKIPPLRDRREDIPLLANYFLDTFAQENNRQGMRFSQEALRCLVNARWEGNVRELRNLVESLVVLAPEDEVGREDLPAEYRQPEGGSVEGPAGIEAPMGPAEAATPGGGMTMDEIERRAILEALERTGGNRTQAAELLGIGLRTLQRKLKEYRSAGKSEGR